MCMYVYVLVGACHMNFHYIILMPWHAGKLIAQAVRAGGSDPLANSRLREVLNAAKLASLPNDIIERNMKKAAEKSGADFTEVVYEAYGPGGTGFIMECLTDNVVSGGGGEGREEMAGPQGHTCTHE
jgi:hypothetical protein